LHDLKPDVVEPVSEPVSEPVVIPSYVKPDVVAPIEPIAPISDDSGPVLALLLVALISWILYKKSQ